MMTLRQRQAVALRDERTQEFREWNARPASERDVRSGDADQCASWIRDIVMDDTSRPGLITHSPPIVLSNEEFKAMRARAVTILEEATSLSPRVHTPTSYEDL